MSSLSESMHMCPHSLIVSSKTRMTLLIFYAPIAQIFL